MDHQENLLVAELKQQNLRLQSQVASLNQRNEQLSEIINSLQRMIYGQRSEKRTYVLPDPNQLGFLEEIPSNEKTTELSTNTEPSVEVSAHVRKPKRTMEEMIRNLPAEERILDIADADKVDEFGKPLIPMGKSYVRTEIEVHPRVIKAVKIYQKTYRKADYDEETGNPGIVKAPVPEPLIPHSYVSPSLAAEIIIGKTADGLPFYRQALILGRDQLEIPRNTLAGIYIRVSQKWLSPFLNLLHQELLRQTVIHADETTVQVLKEPGKAPAAESRMWVYTSAPRSDHQVRYFEYQPGRSGDYAEAFLQGYTGILETDGYSGYNKVQSAVRACCWAHMRRYWREAIPNIKGITAKESEAVRGFHYCEKLFALEREYRKLSDEERQKARQEKSRPVVDEYFEWVKTLTATGGKLGQAVTYARNQEQYLRAFLDHGILELSNNPAENTIRPFVLGRKNWLFADSQNGAKALAACYTILETAKANHLDIRKYLDWLLSTLPRIPESQRTEELKIMLPWDTEVQRFFRTRDY